jgi:hypothetical protein
MINEYLPYFIALGGIILIPLAIMLITMGKTIEELPTEKRNSIRSLSSPIPATKIAGILIIMGYFASAYASIQPEKIFMVLGIAGMVGMYLIMMTAIVFSFAVYSAINKRNKEHGIVT